MLAPGGLLCFRDYGLYDAAQLRAKPANLITERLHKRSDGTLSYYFSVADVEASLAAAGFHVQEVQWCTVRCVNRKLGLTLNRVWVHAKAWKPLLPA